MKYVIIQIIYIYTETNHIQYTMYTYKTNINTSLRFAKIHCGRDACSDPAFDKGLRESHVMSFLVWSRVGQGESPEQRAGPKGHAFFLLKKLAKSTGKMEPLTLQPSRISI